MVEERLKSHIFLGAYWAHCVYEHVHQHTFSFVLFLETSCIKMYTCLPIFCFQSVRTIAITAKTLTQMAPPSVRLVGEGYTSLPGNCVRVCEKNDPGI